MSHFTVLVIGEDYEAQLAPYNEEIRVAPYPRYEDDPAWLRRLYREHHDGADPASDEELVKFLNERWSDEDEKYFVDEKGIYQMSTYNPDSKWDWYSVGGRWAGFFKLKPNGVGTKGAPGLMGDQADNDVDVVRKGDVDVESMRDEDGRKAALRWDTAHKLLEGLEPTKPWEEFHGKAKAAVEALPEDTDPIIIRGIWDAARKAYHDQPGPKAFRAYQEKMGDKSVLWWDSPEDYEAVTRQEFIDYWRARAVQTYAYVKDGQWFAPGRMGWFGVSTDGKEEKDAFIKEFNEMFEALPDDTLLTLVDCHI